MRWSAPDTLWGPQSTRIYVESPEIVQKGDSLLLIGSPSFASDTLGRLVPPPGVAMTSGLFAGIRLSLARRTTRAHPGRLVPLPAGIVRMRRVRVGQATNGDVAIVFGGPAENGDSLAPSSTVWTAMQRADGWTLPTIIIHPSEGIEWSGSSISTVFHSPTGDLLTAPLALWDTTKLLQLHPDGWRVRKLHFSQHFYSSVVALPSSDSVLVLAYVSPSTIEFPRGGIFVSRSSNAGERWSHPVVLSAVGTAPAHHSRLIRANDGTLALTWLEENDPNDSTSRLHLATSTDDGVSWRQQVSETIAGMPTDLRATSDGLSRIHIVLDSASNSTSAPRHLVWNGARWVRSALPAPVGNVVPTPTIAPLGRDSVLVVWAMDVGHGFAPFTMMSVGHLACTP
jgi:hypothetical protein